MFGLSEGQSLWLSWCLFVLWIGFSGWLYMGAGGRLGKNRNGVGTMFVLLSVVLFGFFQVAIPNSMLYRYLAAEKAKATATVTSAIEDGKAVPLLKVRSNQIVQFTTPTVRWPPEDMVYSATAVWEPVTSAVSFQIPCPSDHGFTSIPLTVNLDQARSDVVLTIELYDRTGGKLVQTKEYPIKFDEKISDTLSIQVYRYPKLRFEPE